MVKIDYFAGTYGKFFEYIVNVYILGTPASKTDIFTWSGISHCADNNYKYNRIAYAFPYSSWLNTKFERSMDCDKFIRIVINNFTDDLFFIILTNGIIRVDDRGFDLYMAKMPAELQQSQSQFRNVWLSKIENRMSYPDMMAFYCYDNFAQVTQPTFEFSYEAFLTYPKFCQELQRLSNFLGYNFSPSAELHKMWTKFINKNHGVISLDRCDKIIQSILTATEMNINCTVLEEAWINYNLSKIYNIYTGKMFEDDEYPQTTLEVCQEISNAAVV